MYFWIFLILVCALFIFLFFTENGHTFIDFLRFCHSGRKKGFLYSELMLLWRVNALSGKNSRAHFFSSIRSLDFCIRIIQKEMESAKGSAREKAATTLLSKLFSYRTQFELELMQEKYHIENTTQMEIKQVCMLLSQKVGSIYVRVEEVTEDCVRVVMFDSSANKASKHKWNGDYAQVYFWRKGDAGYFFVSKVLSGRQRSNCYEMCLAHSDEIRRTQKRKSVRASCRFDATLFPLYSSLEFNNKYEKNGGIKCMIKNISEDGAMIYVKGKAERGVNLKLQFKINKKNVIMCGNIVRFLYDEKSNTSKLHFNCGYITEEDRNVILSFVYNIAEKQDPNIATSLFESDEADIFENDL